MADVAPPSVVDFCVIEDVDSPVVEGSVDDNLTFPLVAICVADVASLVVNDCVNGLVNPPVVTGFVTGDVVSSVVKDCVNDDVGSLVVDGCITEVDFSGFAAVADEGSSVEDDRVADEVKISAVDDTVTDVVDSFLGINNVADFVDSSMVDKSVADVVASTR